MHLLSIDAPPFEKAWGGWCRADGQEWTTGPDSSAEADLSRARIVVAGLAGEAVTGKDKPGSSLDELVLSQVIAHNAAAKLADPSLSDAAYDDFTERLWHERVWGVTIKILLANRGPFQQLAEHLHRRKKSRVTSCRRRSPGSRGSRHDSRRRGFQHGPQRAHTRHTRPTEEELEEVERRRKDAIIARRPGLSSVWDAGDDPGPIPPRQWLLGNQFCSGFISCLVSAGGVGKSSLRLLQYISLALGRPLCGQHVFHRCSVLLISLEDDDDELQRRIQAVLLHYGIARSELKGWLFCKYVKRSKIAQLKDKERVAGPLEEEIRDAIDCYQPDLVALDPFVKLHSISARAIAAI